METPEEKWAQAIRDLLERHKLTIRGAARKAKRPAIRTYLADWLAGHIPQWETAVDFLEHFPRDEAVQCLRAARLPIPDEWTEVISETPVVRLFVEPDFGLLSEETKKEVVEAVNAVLDKYRKHN